MNDAVRMPSGASAAEEAGQIEIYFDRLWPLMRSLSGDGVRQTHDILGELLPLERIEVPSGSEAFDWTVPPEWRVHEAYVVTPDGRRILDVDENNLHLVNYSTPFRGSVSRAELDRHLHSRPDLPEAIPYITNYYTRDWGFCLGDRMRQALPNGNYEVVIDAEMFDGAMTLSEAVLPGAEESEVLISTYSCHPSMANDNLSGLLVAAFLYRRLADRPDRRLTYRFVFVPETIGCIAYLDRRGAHLRDKTVAGYVLSCIGDRGPISYKRSRRTDSLADRAACRVLAGRAGNNLRVFDFAPDGSDERQYCSPGFNLPVGVVARSIYSHFPEYHTSLDNRDLVSFEAMSEAVDALLDICLLLDRNIAYRNLSPYGEPHLGKRQLFPQQGGSPDIAAELSAFLWLLNLSDGGNDLLTIAERSGMSFDALHAAARSLVAADLLEPVSEVQS